jgi:hypothetical protein
MAKRGVSCAGSKVEDVALSIAVEANGRVTLGSAVALVDALIGTW